MTHRRGFIVAAPQSGTGKTTITLGLLRALQRSGETVKPAKAGPDFIDPAFHEAACGQASVNLDPWAMRQSLLNNLCDSGDALLVVEAMMGLFDGAADGSGSAADLAVWLGLPIVLVVDAARQSHSIAALVQGFAGFRRDVKISGVILNRVGSARHELMLRDALAAIDMPVLGAVPRDAALELPSRHLGLVQAREHSELDTFIDHAGDVMAAHIDLVALAGLDMAPATAGAPDAGSKGIVPRGNRIAIALDDAFAFSYPHLLRAWRSGGAELTFFSPLADEAPDKTADVVLLPGGYPELHGPALCQNKRFLEGLVSARDRGAFIYGECGGYMVLGEGIIDANGQRHAMAGLLPLETSFAQRKLHLGYRVAKAEKEFGFGQIGDTFSAHEFHYTTATGENGVQSLFSVQDARSDALGSCGMWNGNVAGSYMHLIDKRMDW